MYFQVKLRKLKINLVSSVTDLGGRRLHSGVGTV